MTFQTTYTLPTPTHPLLKKHQEEEWENGAFCPSRGIILGLKGWGLFCPRLKLHPYGQEIVSLKKIYWLISTTNSRHKLRLGRGRKKESLEILFFLVKTSECISASTMIHILESSNTYRIWWKNKTLPQQNLSRPLSNRHVSQHLRRWHVDDVTFISKPIREYLRMLTTNMADVVSSIHATKMLRRLF